MNLVRIRHAMAVVSITLMTGLPPVFESIWKNVSSFSRISEFARRVTMAPLTTVLPPRVIVIVVSPTVDAAQTV